MGVELYQGDCLEVMRGMPDEYVHTCVTSPPYFGLRDYGVDGQIGLESRPEEYVERLVEVFREVRRLLRDDGTLWLNIGDSYNGSGGAGGDYSPGGLKDGQPRYPGRRIANLKPKDLIGIPWMLAFALRDDGWYLRSDIIWAKNNCMPESVTDRPTKAHEYIFLLSKSRQYYYDADAIREPYTEERAGKVVGRAVHDSSIARGGDLSNIGGYPKTHDGRNKRSVWAVNTVPYGGAHFAVFPVALIEPCILAGAPVDGVVLDPFVGSGTTAVACMRLKRKCVGIELNPEYLELARKRIAETQPALFG